MREVSKEDSTSGVALAGLEKKFSLDPAILGPNSAATLELGGAADADVVSAIVGNQPFPARANGIIDLTHISLTASGGRPVAFQGGGVTLGFSFSAGVTAGAGVFDQAQDAIAALGLGETPGLDLTIGAAPNSRYALLRTGYQASGSVSGSHPIGTVGSFTFGATGAASGLSAVLHRFPNTAGADTVLLDTVRSWKLPRHIRAADAIEPATWIVAEANGSLAVNLGASLGYNFNFVRQAKALGLSGDIGLKIDAAATATFGFEVSGRYLVVVGRESDAAASQKLRLRLFKLSRNGMQFGLNLKVVVTGVDTLTPNSVDDFVKAVFGVHGAQIVNALGQIEKWTDPKQSVGQLVAGLTNDRALALLKTVTGVDPQTAFDAAWGKLLEAIKLYRGLPAKVSSELLGILNKLDAPATATFQDALTRLGSSDAAAQKEALSGILNTAGITTSPIGTLLGALADKGLLNLLDRLPDVRQVANTALSILNGGVIAKLQDLIDNQLDLNQVIRVVQQTDFNKLDSFLVGRLSAFFDKTLGFADLNDVKNTIHMVVGKRQEIYDKARTALNSRYGLDIAAKWQRSSSSTAVVDVEFDLSDASAQQLFQDVVEATDSALDRLFTNRLPSVHLNAAVISHELTRKTTLDLSLPHFDFRSQSVTDALANVTAEDDQGRLLLYDARGSNTVSVRNKFRSGVTMTIAAVVSRTGAGALPDLRIHSTDGTTWSYQLLFSKANLKRKELDAITRPFILQYMSGQFTQGTTLSAWYDQLDSTSEGILKNGPEVIGDTCAALEVTLPGDTLGAWALPVTNVSSAAQNMSLAIQRALKNYVPWFYLNDIGKLKNLASSAPLLAWASIPDAVGFDGSNFSASGGHDVFWDHVDVTLRKAAALHPGTAANLRTRLPGLRVRLEEAVLDSTVQFYRDDQARNILVSATSQFGDTLLESLLRFESQILEKAASALKDIQAFLAVAGTSPTQAVHRLADFAADITTAFNKLTGNNVFADLVSFRAVAQMVFAEASRALNSSLAVQPRAMLTLDILNPAPPRQFQLASFLNGALPASDDIAVAQRLVSV
ncbi:MAG: hypothetical protein LAQ69_05630 [Acidobacteriia bacterium]|nr:hypothetical protein [Terriglobia bacterium]